jgi:hypothetical protein
MKPTRATTAGTIMAIAIISCAFIAIAYVAIRTASNTWESVLRTLLAMILLISVVAARFREGRERAFWLGFSVFGWSAFVLGFDGSTVISDGFWASPRTRLNPSWLVSDVLIDILPIVRKPTNLLNEIHPISEKTLGVLHSLMTIVLATCGGSIVVVATLRRRDANDRYQPISKKVWFSHVTIILIISAMIGGSIARSELRRDSDSARLRFIPSGMIDESVGLKRYEIEDFTKRLVAARERPIGDLDQTDRDFIMFRFLQEQSSHSLCVRIEKTEFGAKLRAVVLDDENEGIAIEKNLTLTVPQWDELLRRSIKADYWNKSFTRRYSSRFGPTILIEGVKDRKYHAVYRFGDNDIHFESFCSYIIELTGIGI